jgi:hypothetical protein
MVASYVREQERIFLRWLENVERLLNQPVDRDARLQGMGRRLQRSRICRRDGAALRPAPGAALIGGALKDPEEFKLGHLGNLNQVIKALGVTIRAMAHGTFDSESYPPPMGRVS